MNLTDNITDGIYKHLGAQKETIVNFFIIFSLFEFALKHSEYRNGNKKKVAANWDIFARDLKDEFVSKINDNSNLKKAITYLEETPPKKQILDNGKLDWEKSKKRQKEPLLTYLLRIVRLTRNNLFHGGKYPLHLVYPDRNDKLLEKLSYCFR